jgi:hypothetical protein
MEMKTQMLRIAVFVTALLVASAAIAQSAPGDVLVNVPFSFVVGKHQMQPGRYQVTPLANGFLRMFDKENPANQLFLPVHSVESRSSKGARLVFHRYGATYFLAQVWNGNGDIGRELPKSKAEKEIASGSIDGTRPKSEIAVLRPER